MTTMGTWKGLDLNVKDTNLAFKYTVEKMTLGKDTRQEFFIDESRIWNF